MGLGRHRVTQDLSVQVNGHALLFQHLGFVFHSAVLIHQMEADKHTSGRGIVAGTYDLEAQNILALFHRDVFHIIVIADLLRLVLILAAQLVLRSKMIFRILRRQIVFHNAAQRTGVIFQNRLEGAGLGDLQIELHPCTNTKVQNTIGCLAAASVVADGNGIKLPQFRLHTVINTFPIVIGGNHLVAVCTCSILDVLEEIPGHGVIVDLHIGLRRFGFGFYRHSDDIHRNTVLRYRDGGLALRNTADGQNTVAGNGCCGNGTVGTDRGIVRSCDSLQFHIHTFFCKDGCCGFHRTSRSILIDQRELHPLAAGRRNSIILACDLEAQRVFTSLHSHGHIGSVSVAPIRCIGINSVDLILRGPGVGRILRCQIVFHDTAHGVGLIVPHRFECTGCGDLQIKQHPCANIQIQGGVSTQHRAGGAAGSYGIELPRLGEYIIRHSIPIFIGRNDLIAVTARGIGAVLQEVPLQWFFLFDLFQREPHPLAAAGGCGRIETGDLKAKRIFTGLHCHSRIRSVSGTPIGRIGINSVDLILRGPGVGCVLGGQIVFHDATHGVGLIIPHRFECTGCGDLQIKQYPCANAQVQSGIGPQHRAGSTGGLDGIELPRLGGYVIRHSIPIFIGRDDLKAVAARGVGTVLQEVPDQRLRNIISAFLFRSLHRYMDHIQLLAVCGDGDIGLARRNARYCNDTVCSRFCRSDRAVLDGDGRIFHSDAFQFSVGSLTGRHSQLHFLNLFHSIGIHQ